MCYPCKSVARFIQILRKVSYVLQVPPRSVVLPLHFDQCLFYKLGVTSVQRDVARSVCWGNTRYPLFGFCSFSSGWYTCREQKKISVTVKELEDYIRKAYKVDTFWLTMSAVRKVVSWCKLLVLQHMALLSSVRIFKIYLTFYREADYRMEGEYFVPSRSWPL